MFKSHPLAVMAAAVFLSGPCSTLQAQTSLSSDNIETAEEIRLQQALMLRSMKQKLNHYVDDLQQIDRTKLITQTAPFAALLPQFHPSTPGIVAFQNSPLAAAQYKHLMREWNRYQLLAFLESSKQVASRLILSPEVVVLASSLVRGAQPVIQVMGQILLPNVELSGDSFDRFFNRLQEFGNAARTGEVVGQN